MKKMITVVFVSMFVIFAACSGGDYNEGSGGDNPTDVCGNGTCGNGETHESCPADCKCGNGVCDAGETAQNCSEDCHVTPPCTANARSIQACYSMAQLMDADSTSTDYLGSAGWDTGTSDASYTMQMNIQPFRVDATSVCWETPKFAIESITGVVDMTLGDVANGFWVGHNVHPTSISVKTWCGNTVLETIAKPVPMYVAKKTFVECITSGGTDCTTDGDGTFGYPVCIQGSLRGGWKNICTIKVNGAVDDCFEDNETIVNTCDLIYNIVGCYDAQGNTTHQCVEDGSTAP
jgi:hypothetical protein